MLDYAQGVTAVAFNIGVCLCMRSRTFTLGISDGC
jgi:hypothetical protein